jgi:hypothetical protein
MRLIFYVGLIVLFFSCRNKKWSNEKYGVNENFFFESRINGYRGYSWIYLCQEGNDSCIDIYKQRDTINGEYFDRIEKINITKIELDTVIFSVTTISLGVKRCFIDTLLLPNGILLSNKSRYLDCN